MTRIQQLQTEPSIPAVFTSSPVTVVPGALATPDHNRLQPERRLPFLMYEVCFTVRSTSGAGDPDDGSFGGWHVRARMSLDRLPIINDHMPLMMLSPIRQASEESMGSVIDDQVYSFYRWAFREPLFVPAGSVVFTEYLRVAHPRTASESNWTVDVSYKGRLLTRDVPGGAVPVPYAAAFAPIVFSTAHEIGVQKQLGNSLDKPIRINRLLARDVLFANGVAVATEDYADTTLTATLSLTGINDTIQIVPPTTDIIDLVSPYNRDWSMDFEMPPGGRFDGTLTYAGSNSTHIPVIGITGWREEHLP